MSAHVIHLEGLGFWASGLPGWEAATRFARGGEAEPAAPRKPAPALLAPNERRRAPDTVALALQVSLDACEAAGRDAAALPSVFASTHGDLAITDYMCATLQAEPGSVSPTKFHNSVHNAAAGYWTIGAGCMAPATAISAYDATFAEGLLESIGQIAAGEGPVLLVAYDAQSTGPLGAISPSDGLLAAALVLGDQARPGSIQLRVTREPGEARVVEGRLQAGHATNAMAPMLPLLDLLASGGHGVCELHAGPGHRLRVEVRV